MDAVMNDQYVDKYCMYVVDILYIYMLLCIVCSNTMPKIKNAQANSIIKSQRETAFNLNYHFIWNILSIFSNIFKDKMLFR